MYTTRAHRRVSANITRRNVSRAGNKLRSKLNSRRLGEKCGYTCYIYPKMDARYLRRVAHASSDL